MSLVKDGTTALGFKCDVKGCGMKATHTPILCVPHEGYPSEMVEPSRFFIFNQVCMEHRAAVKQTDMLGPKMRKLAKDMSARRGLKPAFERAFVLFWPAISSEYQQYLALMGIVPTDDQIAKGELILPPGININ